jgi:hypothetical protein
MRLSLRERAPILTEVLSRIVNGRRHGPAFQLRIRLIGEVTVGRFERLCDLFRDRKRLVERDRALHDVVREGRTFNEFHHHTIGIGGE